jgi:hypothetical protein
MVMNWSGRERTSEIPTGDAEIPLVSESFLNPSLGALPSGRSLQFTGSGASAMMIVVCTDVERADRSVRSGRGFLTSSRGHGHRSAECGAVNSEQIRRVYADGAVVLQRGGLSDYAVEAGGVLAVRIRRYCGGANRTWSLCSLSLPLNTVKRWYARGRKVVSGAHVNKYRWKEPPTMSVTHLSEDLLSTSSSHLWADCLDCPQQDTLSIRSVPRWMDGVPVSQGKSGFFWAKNRVALRCSTQLH